MVNHWRELSSPTSSNLPWVLSGSWAPIRVTVLALGPPPQPLNRVSRIILLRPWAPGPALLIYYTWGRQCSPFSTSRANYSSRYVGAHVFYLQLPCLGIWQFFLRGSGSPSHEPLRLGAFFHQPRCPFSLVWGLMAGLRGLPAMGAFHCLGAGWSQWRPPDIPGTYLPYSLMQ